MDTTDSESETCGYESTASDSYDSERVDENDSDRDSLEQLCEQFSDTDLDPRQEISPHPSDNDLAKEGYELTSEEESEAETDVSITPESIRCSCFNCKVVYEDGNDYCCGESETILNLIQLENAECITTWKKFIDVVENKDILLLLRYTYSQSGSGKRDLN